MLQRLIIIAAYALFAWTAQAQTVLYVDQNAPGPVHDGWTWCTAFTDIQDALLAANYNVIIRVADGTYTPDRGTGDRNATFQLKNTVKLEGGYAGCTAPNAKARDVARFETILSGDLARNDVGGFDDPSRNDNCYHVVTAIEVDETAVLEGFTVAGGNAVAKEPTTADLGRTAPSRTFIEKTFRDDPFSTYGGGAWVFQSSPTFKSSTFVDNQAGDFGGAASVLLGGEPLFMDCTFVGNQARGGGAVYSGSSSPAFIGCRFVENTAPQGGALASLGSAVDLVNCLLIANEAEIGGALVIAESASFRVFSCLFNGNRASDSGGAIYLSSDGLWIRGSTFNANAAPEAETLYCPGGNDLTIDSSILADVADLAGSLNTCTATISYSNVYGGWPGGTNIFAPLNFRDVDGPDNILGNEDDDLRPTAASPGINLGRTDYWVDPNERDLSGHARVLCGRIDMGAYEFGLGDVDCDFDVDLDDFVEFSECVTGPDGTPFDSGCAPFDSDSDQNIDIGDAAAFQREFSGP